MTTHPAPVAPAIAVRHRDRRLGCDVAVTTVGSTGSAAQAASQAARDVLDDLDHRWSRFRPTSEVSRLNAAAGGGPVRVSAATAALVGAAVEVWLATGGLVDASVLGALEELGYDRSFEHLADGRAATPDAHRPSPGLAGVEVDRASSTVALPAEVRIDPGGIGKGRIADAMADAAMAAGAIGCCIDLGGDVAVRGTTAHGEAWVVDVEDPTDPGRALTSVALSDGAVATSGVLRRRWATTSGWAHHLVDPRTGRPAESDLVAATVVAADAMWAEVLAKAAVIVGLAEAVPLLAASGASGLLVTDDGLAVRTADLDRFELDAVQPEPHPTGGPT